MGLKSGRRVGRPVDEFASAAFDDFAHPGALVGREVVHDDHQSRTKRWRQHPVHVGLTILYGSPAAEPMLGYRPEELLHANVFEHLHPEEAGRLSSELARLVEHPKSSTTAEFRFPHKDGCWRHLEGVARNLFDEPSVGGIVVNCRDLTERKLVEQRLRGSEELFRAAFEAAAVGMAHVAPDGRWLRVNDCLCNIVGYSREELWGMSFQDITHLDDLEADLEQARRMIAGEIRSYYMEKR